MATLQQIADSPVLPAVLREAARHERPSTLRRQATLGGCVAAKEAASDLLAALLAHEAVVSITGPGGTRRSELAEFLADGRPDRARIITGVTVCTSGAAFAARTARTGQTSPSWPWWPHYRGGEWRLALEGVALRRLKCQGSGAVRSG